MAQSAPHPDSFTAWAFTKVGGQLEKVSLPWKDPQEGQIVVKVLACGVCGRSVLYPPLPLSPIRRATT